MYYNYTFKEGKEMKKKLISAIALSLCLCMGAMVGCSSKKDSSSEPPKPLTKDEILAKIGEAYEATKAYKDGYTVIGTQKSEYKSFGEEEAEVYNTTIELTANPNQKVVYYKQAGVEGYEIQKLLKNGADYIMYQEYKEGDESEQDYTKYSEAYSTFYINEYYGFERIIDQYIQEESFAIASIDAYNAGYAKIIADSVAAVNAGSEDEESDFYGWTNPACSALISAEETADGSYVYTSKMSMQMSNTVEKTTAVMTQETVITAKDGKLTSMKEVSETTRTKEISDTETQTYSSKSEENFAITYTFDQAKYDGVSVTVPATVESRSYYSKEVTVMVNGIEFESANTRMSGNTIQAAVDSMTSNFKNEMNANENNATITLYNDAAYTQAIDSATLSEADFYALDTIYVKAELKEGYALMNQSVAYGFAADVAAEYKTVYSAMLGYTNQMQLAIVSVANPYNVAEKAAQVGVQKVTVNGAAYTEDTVTFESGKTYEINYVMEMAQADLNIFMMW